MSLQQPSCVHVDIIQWQGTGVMQSVLYCCGRGTVYRLTNHITGGQMIIVELPTVWIKL